jgi:1-acyl-sn-glycerol-3-phosphate acyltransferase
MELDAFQEQIRHSGSYDTAAASRTRFDRVMGRSDAWFYAHLAAVVARGAWQARRGRYDDRAWSVSSHNTLRIMERCGACIRIRGANQLAAAGGPAVVVANHMSMAETFLLPCQLLAFASASIVVKESLLRYPLFGAILRATSPIRVTRDNPRQDLRAVLEEGQRRLANGRLVVIFPQATRRPAFTPAAFNSIGVKLAARAGVPVIPLALRTDFQGTGRWIKDFGPLDREKPVFFEFGEPLRIRHNERDVHAASLAFIGDRMREWGVPVETTAPSR